MTPLLPKNWRSTRGHAGMTLRDWFAGKALAGMCACSDIRCTNARLAEVSYSLADAMLAARR